MKNLICALIIATLGLSAIAAENISIESVSQSGNLMPVIGENQRPVLTTVQATYYACGTFEAENFDYSLSMVDENIADLAIYAKPNLADCRALPTLKKITLNTTDFPILKKVRVVQDGKKATLKVQHDFVY